MKFDPGPLVRAFADFMKVIGIKTASGRTMLGVEFFAGIFLLLGLSFILSHDFLELVVTAIQGKEHTSRTGKHFEIFAIIMVFSVLVVLLNEVIHLIITSGGDDS